MSMQEIIDHGRHSRSQVYVWMRQVRERKPREGKALEVETVTNAVMVVIQYPHFGGLKGQAYMLYHQLGFIAQHTYKHIKKLVQRRITWEAYDRKLIPERASSYEHVRPESVGEIWAEDFTRIEVESTTVYVAIVIDVASTMFLGWDVALRPCDSMVSSPVLQALAFNDRKPPEQFLISDNGSPYRSEAHGTLLDIQDIVHKCIPSCRPQYNGSAEFGAKDLKQVFYANRRSDTSEEVKEEKEGGEEKEANKEKNFMQRVRRTIRQSIHELNAGIPRPVLGGVVPADVHDDTAPDKKEAIRAYKHREQARSPTNPLHIPLWEAVCNVLASHKRSDEYVLLTHYLLGKKPLRRVAKLMRECVG